MIRLPKTVDEALSFALADDEIGTYRAGGTDLQELRRHLPIHSNSNSNSDPRARPRFAGPLVDLRDVPGLDSVAGEPGGAGAAWIGALTTLAQLAGHPLIRERWPGIAEAAGALANPQIRAIATAGGNLVQSPRCWYYRHPDYSCLRKGGATCFAREGDHLFHVAFDTSPCVAPHPSTLALALLAYEAEVELLIPSKIEPARVPIADVLGLDALAPGTLITTIRLPPPVPQERTAYVRASNRAYAEWALAEVSVRLVLDGSGRVVFVRVAGGGVAPTPLRLDAVEDALIGELPGELSEAPLLAKAAALARVGAKPLAMTAYKLDLLEGAVLEALERALASTPTPARVEAMPLAPQPNTSREGS